MHQSPWDTVARPFGMTEIVTPYARLKILARPYVAATRLSAF